MIATHSARCLVSSILVLSGAALAGCGSDEGSKGGAQAGASASATGGSGNGGSPNPQGGSAATTAAVQGGNATSTPAANQGGNTANTTAAVGQGGSTPAQTQVTTLPDGIPVGNPDGKCSIPTAGALEDVSSPTKVVGDGTRASCTSAAVVAAVWNDGAPVNRVTFNCGTEPTTIVLTESIRVPNAPSGASTVIDGGGKVTLSGGGKVRIVYSNACNNTLGWYTDHCQDQDSPHLALQNLTFIDGNAANNQKSDTDEPSGGAVFMRSGRLKIVNCRFFNNKAIAAASDFGGGAVRVLGQYNSQAVQVINSTFGGKEGSGNSAANGGALSSIGTSWNIVNSLFSYNTAIGTGANDGNGGNGGAIYNDGNLFTTKLCGVKMTQNVANEGGGAIFFVSNDKTGSIAIEQSILTQNTSKGFQSHPGMFIIAKAGDPTITSSTVE